VPTLFGIEHGKVITANLPLELSIDSMIPLAPDIMLERDVREVYELPVSQIAAKRIEMRLTIDPSRHQCSDQHPITQAAQHILRHC